MTDYALHLQAVADRLAAINPARVVTRTFRDYQMRDAADLAAGVYTVMASNIAGYPFAGQRESDFADQRFLIVGQAVIDEDADGPTLEATEFEMIGEVEALIDNVALLPDELAGLHILDIQQSGQIDNPYCGIVASMQNAADT